MASTLRLVIDRQNKTLIEYQGSIKTLPVLYQSNSPTLQISFVDPTGNVFSGSPYSLVDMSSYGLRVSIGQTPTGTAGGPAPLTLQDTFTWNSTGNYFTADLSLAVAAIESYIGSAASKSAYFEVNLTLAGNRDTVLQLQCTLGAVVDELTTTSPTPVDQYLTKAENLALFVKKVGLVGETVVFKSPNGVYGLEIGCNDDGTMKADIITL